MESRNLHTGSPVIRYEKRNKCRGLSCFRGIPDRGEESGGKLGGEEERDCPVEDGYVG